MNKEYIINSIENLLNNEDGPIDKTKAQIQKNSVDEALENVANRLIDNYKRFQLGICF